MTILPTALGAMLMFCHCNSQPAPGQNPENPTPPAGDYPAEVLGYNYAVGTQTIGPSYQLPDDENKLVGSAEKILDMGSNILKITLAPSSYGLMGSYSSSKDILEKQPSFGKVLEMDFKYYLFWVYAPKLSDAYWKNGVSEADAAIEYENMYDLATYLLTKFKGSGKEFYLGNWEGDWHLLDNYNSNQQTVSRTTIDGMTDWLNIRQKAIDDAVNDNPASDVKVYCYVEVNQVMDAVNKGYDRVVNRVIPHVDVDFVSYSSYDATANATNANAMRANLRGALGYIESQLKAKSGISGKRVFIGEYGYPAQAHSEANQNAYSKLVMKYSLEWGCPFVLYWEMYNNEVENGVQKGYWLIDDNGTKREVYRTHKDFYETMKAYVDKFLKENGRLPSRDEYNSAAQLKF